MVHVCAVLNSFVVVRHATRHPNYLDATVAVVDAEEVRGKAKGGPVEAVHRRVARDHPERDVDEARQHDGGVLHLGAAAAYGLEPPARHVVNREDAPGAGPRDPGAGGGLRHGGGGRGDEVVEHERGADLGEALEVGGGDAAAFAGDGARAPAGGGVAPTRILLPAARLHRGRQRGADPERGCRGGGGLLHDVGDEEREPRGGGGGANGGQVLHGRRRGGRGVQRGEAGPWSAAAAAVVVVVLLLPPRGRRALVVMSWVGG